MSHAKKSLLDVIMKTKQRPGTGKPVIPFTDWPDLPSSRRDPRLRKRKRTGGIVDFLQPISTGSTGGPLSQGSPDSSANTSPPPKSKARKCEIVISDEEGEDYV